jgi:glutathione synthase/RimK-type ligase-like ATP-grasp enzyme
MRFVYVMDPMDRILPDKDTTFAFQRAAQRRGHVSLHCELRDVYMEGGDVWARVRPVRVSDSPPTFRSTPRSVYGLPRSNASSFARTRRLTPHTCTSA